MSTEDGFEFIKIYTTRGWRLTPEVHAWLNQEIGPGSLSSLQFIVDPKVIWCAAQSTSGTEVWFKNDKDAVMFKLTWVGI